MPKIVLISVLLLFSQLSFGNTVAKIKSILLVDSSNLVYIYPEGGVTNPPSCHGSMVITFHLA